MRTDVIVLGAGMIGLSAALALQARGRSVVLADRRPAAEETSYGNAGLIHREGVVPYAFPRAWRTILKTALNQTTQSNLHWRALPWIAPFLYQYWRHGSPERIDATTRGAVPLVERSIAEHEALMGPADALGLVRKTGYLKIYRSEQGLADEIALDQRARRLWGVTSEAMTGAQIRELEPDIMGPLAGGLLMPQPWSVSDPGALGKAYATLFVERGGTFITADARTLERVGDGWQIQRVEGAVTAREVVVALGPWTGALLEGLGVRLPFFVKRGYHMHYRPLGKALPNHPLGKALPHPLGSALPHPLGSALPHPLGKALPHPLGSALPDHPLGKVLPSRPIVNGDDGYMMTPMALGIRVTTGAEFTTHGATPTPVQLGKVEPLARALFPLGERVEAKPWMGARPCLPDLLPMIGAVPGQSGLWIDSGHHHLGFTLGPVSGRLIAEMMTGAETFTDPRPYRVDRF